jgi:ribulose-phosphate 3-epimerase
MALLFPSLISGRLLNLQEEISLLEPHCDGFHIDIMDFHFVPNLTWGPLFVKQIRQATSKQLFIHLMVEYPEKYLPLLELYPGDIVSIHIESPTTSSLFAMTTYLKAHNLIPSIAINPETPLESIISLPFYVEHVLLMSVHPGFSGQKFLPHTLEKLKALNLFRQSHNLCFSIAIDGGITSCTIPQLIHNGADQLAIATAIFMYEDRVSAIKNLFF